MPELIANYLTVDPATGAVGADFTGHVHAQGLDLDASSGSLTPQHTVRWLDTGDGSLVADLGGLLGGFGNELDIYAHSHDLNNFLAGLSMSSGAAFGQLVHVDADQSHRLLLDNGDRSDYLQMAAAVGSESSGTPGKSQAGLTTITWPGGVTSFTSVIQHNLGVAGVNGVFSARAGGTINRHTTGTITGTAANTVSVSFLVVDGGVAPALNATQKMSYLIWTP